MKLTDEQLFSILEYSAKALGASDEELYEFTRCVRPDGSVYGSRGKCKKGTETSEKALKTPKENKKSAKSSNRLEKVNQDVLEGTYYLLLGQSRRPGRTAKIREMRNEMIRRGTHRPVGDLGVKRIR